MHYIFERTKLLYANEDPKWLSIVEQKIYEYGMSWRSKRQEALDKLNHFLKYIQYLRPVEIYAKENEFSLELIKQARERDIKMGGCSVGPHKTDYEGAYGKKRLSLASNGEQCLGQISIFLAIIFYIIQSKNVIFLMDEVFSHLDPQNQKLLIQEFQKLDPHNFQVIITLPKLLQDFENVQYITI